MFDTVNDLTLIVTENNIAVFSHDLDDQIFPAEVTKFIEMFNFRSVDNTKDYEKLVNSITAKEVQDFLAKLLKQNNEIQVIMTVPEENK